MSNYSFIDMHIHTTHSHESQCNDKVIDVLNDAERIAERLGKDCLISITDHNSVMGVIEAKKLLASGKFPHVKLISGIELSVDMNEFNSMFGGNKVLGNCHILAFGFDENNKELIEYSKNHAGCSSPKLSFTEISKLVRNAGGYLVIAHPGLIKLKSNGLTYYTGNKNRSQIQDAGKNGRPKSILRYMPASKEILEVIYDKAQELSDNLVVGMERFHPDNYPCSMDRKIEEICKQENLIQTAGSDYHGPNLHTEYSVGNVLTQNFQNYFKSKNNNCGKYRNGLYVSSLPGVEFLAHEQSKSDKIEMLAENGKEISYDEYTSLINDYIKYNQNNNFQSKGKSYQ